LGANIFKSVAGRDAWNMQDSTLLASWMMDLESGSKHLEQGIGIGKEDGWGVLFYILPAGQDWIVDVLL